MASASRKRRPRRPGSPRGLGYYHAGEERNLASSAPEKRTRAVQYAKDTVNLAADAGASFTEVAFRVRQRM